MLYQNLMMGSRPYLIALGQMTGFGVHRHPELELSYCVEGSYDIFINKKCYHLQAGDLAIVGSMVSHMFPPSEEPACQAMTIEAGPALLAEYFSPFAKTIFTEPVIHLSASSQHRPLSALLEECIALRREPADFSELTIQGNLYKIFAYILSHFVSEPSGDSKRLRDVAKVEQALEMIESHYAQALKLEDVATATGYEKSNFCRIFKKITGSTFHAALNSRRLDNACKLLCNSTLSVDEIAQQTGLTDAKTFCRLFKKQLGMTPGTYRKNNR